MRLSKGVALAGCTFALSGCAAVEHVQIVPIVSADLSSITCCEAFIEIPPSTDITIQASKVDRKYRVKLGAKWKF